MTTSPKPYKQAQHEFYELTQSLAEKAFQLIVHNVHDLVYIVGQKQTGINANIWAAISVCRDSEKPADWIIVHGENIRRNATVEMMRHQIETVLRREPLYVFAD